MIETFIEELNSRRLLSTLEATDFLFKEIQKHKGETSLSIGLDTFEMRIRIENAIKESEMNYKEDDILFGKSFTLCEFAYYILSLDELGFEPYSTIEHGVPYYRMRSNIQGIDVTFDPNALNSFGGPERNEQGTIINFPKLPSKETMIILNNL